MGWLAEAASLAGWSAHPLSKALVAVAARPVASVVAPAIGWQAVQELPSLGLQAHDAQGRCWCLGRQAYVAAPPAKPRTTCANSPSMPPRRSLTPSASQIISMRITGIPRVARPPDRGPGSVASAARPCPRPDPARHECSLPSAPTAPPAPARRRIHWAAGALPARRHQAARATAWHAHTSSATLAAQPRWRQPMPWPSGPMPGRPAPAPNTSPAVLDPSPLRRPRRCNGCKVAGFSIGREDGFAERLRRTRVRRRGALARSAQARRLPRTELCRRDEHRGRHIHRQAGIPSPAAPDAPPGQPERQ